MTLDTVQSREGAGGGEEPTDADGAIVQGAGERPARDSRSETHQQHPAHAQDQSYGGSITAFTFREVGAHISEQRFTSTVRWRLKQRIGFASGQTAHADVRLSRRQQRICRQPDESSFHDARQHLVWHADRRAPRQSESAKAADVWPVTKLAVDRTKQERDAGQPGGDGQGQFPARPRLCIVEL